MWKWAENNGRLLAQLHGNLTPAWFSRGPARCLRRFKRSDYDGKGVSLSYLRVVARRLPHLLYGPVKSLRLSRWGKASWRTCRPARHRQNVSVCPMTRRHCPAGVFVKEQRGRRETGRRGKGKPPVYGRGLNRQSPMGLTMEWISLICNRRFIYSSMQI